MHRLVTVADQVPVREHYRLGITGCPACIGNHCRVIGIQVRPETEHRTTLQTIERRSGVTLVVDHDPEADIGQPALQVGETAVSHNRGRAGVQDCENDLILERGRIDRDRNQPHLGSSEEKENKLRAV